MDSWSVLGKIRESRACAHEVVYAHEVMDEHAEVRMGGYNVDNIRRNITRVYKHENYQFFYVKRMTNDFDIAILQLEKVVSFGYNIQPICLPQSSRIDYSEKIATAIGLYDTGSLVTLKLYSRSKAQKTHIQIWTNEQCGKLPKYVNKITDNMVCAGDKARLSEYMFHDFDFGHLVIENEHGSMELVGIYSFGDRSSFSYGTPIVYTYVADFLPWIQSKITNQCTYTPKQASHDENLEQTCIFNQG
ncbi:transmembrane protease serine 11F-like [Sitodiplosis mosellana]|uniref:transmembrane protease serine 11F-like n=1 Tax=Sitodiplosis mosellana TaxID=263140 RepID=UPI00244417FD|nr:transmembrane protease serine 11F-like [Sitodiplosis mosellana]